MRTIVSIILICTVQYAFTQDFQLSSNIQAIVDSMIKINIYKGRAVGYAGYKPNQWRNYEALEEKASSIELRHLTSHKNGIIRCYSFLALIKRNDAQVFEILKQHLDDHEIIPFIEGCIGSHILVGEFYFQKTHSRYYAQWYQLTRQQQNEIDSILLFDDRTIDYRHREVLRRLKPIPKYYQRVKELALKQNTQAVITLAKYQNEADADLILNLLEDKENEYAFIKAAIQFPHEQFYHELLNIFEKEWNKKRFNSYKMQALYQALANYTKDDTLSIFTRTIKIRKRSKRKTLCKYLVAALIKFPNPNYNHLKAKIKLPANEFEEVLEIIEDKL